VPVPSLALPSYSTWRKLLHVTSCYSVSQPGFYPEKEIPPHHEVSEITSFLLNGLKVTIKSQDSFRDHWVLTNGSLGGIHSFCPSEFPLIFLHVSGGDWVNLSGDRQTHTHRARLSLKPTPQNNNKNSLALSPQANCTEWATATWRNLVPTFVDRGVSRGQRGGSPTVVILSFLNRSPYFSFK
jgi:hypothetical protein